MYTYTCMQYAGKGLKENQKVITIVTSRDWEKEWWRDAFSLLCNLLNFYKASEFMDHSFS